MSVPDRSVQVGCSDLAGAATLLPRPSTSISADEVLGQGTTQSMEFWLTTLNSMRHLDYATKPAGWPDRLAVQRHINLPAHR